MNFYFLSQQWLLVPPGFAHKIAQSPLTNNAAALQENWTAAKEYLDRDNVLATCTQLAGDLLYVPRLWMHATRALEECVGVALEFCSAVSVFVCVVFCCVFFAKHCPSPPSLLCDPQRTNAAILVVCLFDRILTMFFFHVLFSVLLCETGGHRKIRAQRAHCGRVVRFCSWDGEGVCGWGGVHFGGLHRPGGRWTKRLLFH